MNEELRPYGTDSTDPPAEPLTREERYLSAIAGVTSSSDIPPKPLTRTEKYLNKIVENGGGGGGGFTPTDEQLAAMNSGITAPDVEQIGTNENNISSLDGKLTAHTAGGSNYDTINGIRVYVSSTAPTGDIPTGSIWIGG